jgi:lysophospholipid acyltransferase (LPLAT)-like uncharacterized protein
LRARIIGTFAAAVLRVLDATWRKDDAEVAVLDELFARDQQLVVAFWHGKFFPLFSLMRGRRSTVFASISLHGEIIAEICRWFGYDCVLIPDTGGEQARQTMLDTVKSSRSAAVAVDGPRGPYHVVKRGAIDLASELGFVVVPVTAACSRRWIDRRRWDLREVPGPFSRLVLAMGKPIRVPPVLDTRTRRAFRIELGESLEALDRRAGEKLQQGRR